MEIADQSLLLEEDARFDRAKKALKLAYSTRFLYRMKMMRSLYLLHAYSVADVYIPDVSYESDRPLFSKVRLLDSDGPDLP